jgi:tetratricopeptide (TPR) repeat protein
VHLATLYKWSQRHEEAVPLFEAAITGLERRLGPDDPDVLSTKVGLSGSYLELRRYPEAQALLEPAIDRIRRVFGGRHNQTQIALYNLACVHANSGRIELALDYLRQATAIGWAYPSGAARDPQLLPLHGDLRFAELDREGRLNAPETWESRTLEAESWIREGRVADAERLLRDLIAGIERFGGYEDRATAPRLALARCWISQGRFDDANGLLVPTLAALRADSRVGSYEHQALELLAQCDIGRGRRESALARISAAASLENPVFENVEKIYATAESQALQGRDEEALRTLARASELGFDDFERLEGDLAFKKLRARAEFVLIAMAAHRRAL